MCGSPRLCRRRERRLIGAHFCRWREDRFGRARCLTLRYSLLLSVWADPSAEHRFTRPHSFQEEQALSCASEMKCAPPLHLNPSPSRCHPHPYLVRKAKSQKTYRREGIVGGVSVNPEMKCAPPLHRNPSPSRCHPHPCRVRRAKSENTYQRAVVGGGVNPLRFFS